MARKSSGKFDESNLNKGQMRKLNALRKSLGADIANKAFGEWYEKQSNEPDSLPVDANVTLITGALEPLVSRENYESRVAAIWFGAAEDA